METQVIKYYKLPSFCFMRKMASFFFVLSFFCGFSQSFYTDSSNVYIASEATVYIHEGTTISNYHPEIISITDKANHVDALVNHDTAKKHFNKEKHYSQKMPPHNVQKNKKSRDINVQTQDQKLMFCLLENQSGTAVLNNTFVYQFISVATIQHFAWLVYRYKNKLVVSNDEHDFSCLPFICYSRPPPVVIV